MTFNLVFRQQEYAAAATLKFKPDELDFRKQMLQCRLAVAYLYDQCSAVVKET